MTAIAGKLYSSASLIGSLLVRRSARRRYLHPLLWPLMPYRTQTFGPITVYYEKRLDGGGRSIGQGMIPFLQSRNMPKLRRVFEWCSGPGFIGFSMLGHELCETLCLADINPAAVAACRRTVAANNLSGLVSIYHSDNLKGIPADERFDLVVANPPHFPDLTVSGEPTAEYEGDRRGHDPDWRVHREFFNTIGPHLSDEGVIILQENTAGSTVETFREMIAQAGLEILFVLGCPGKLTEDFRIYYLGIKRAGAPTPAWARPL